VRKRERGAFSAFSASSSSSSKDQVSALFCRDPAADLLGFSTPLSLHFHYFFISSFGFVFKQ